MEINPNFSANARADYKMVIQAREGSQKAYTELMNRYENSVFFIAVKIVKSRDDARDITANTFAKAFEKLDNYKPDYAFSTWLFKIATNTSIDFMRRKKSLATVSMDANDSQFGPGKRMELPEDSLNPEESSIKRQEIVNLKGMINRLPEEYRDVITLRFFDELSYEEIAVQLDTPVGTVKARIFRAKDMILNVLKGNNTKSEL